MTLLDALVFAFATHPDAAAVAAIERAATAHHADLPLVAAICQHESGTGVYGTILCGAMLRLPRSACVPRRRERCINRDLDAQATYAARLFGGVPRAHWARMLAGYVCGPNAACQATRGAAYATTVLAMRDELARALRGAR